MNLLRRSSVYPWDAGFNNSIWFLEHPPQSWHPPFKSCKYFSTSLAIPSTDSGRSKMAGARVFWLCVLPPLEYRMHRWKASWETDASCRQLCHLALSRPSIALDIKNEAEGSGGLNDGCPIGATAQLPLHNWVNPVYRCFDVFRVCERLGKY